MNWQSQLTQLILSYYRENMDEFRQVKLLQQCKLSRRWRSLRIECPTLSAALALREAGDLLREPIAQLRLARQIRLIVHGDLVANIPVQSTKSSQGSFPSGSDADLLL